MTEFPLPQKSSRKRPVPRNRMRSPEVAESFHSPRIHPSAEEKLRRLANPDVRAWYDNLANGSPITADHYLRSMYVFARGLGTTPAALAKIPDARLHRMLLEFVAAEQKRGLAGSSIATYAKAVRSWLEFHGRKIDRPVRIRNATATPTLKDERVPTQDELRRVLMVASPQQQAAISFIGFAGLRLETVGNYHGDDGLRVSDLPDLKIDGGRVSFERTPARIIARPELSKTGLGYFSFLPPEGCDRVAAYLNARAARGEQVGPDTDLLHPESFKKRFLRSVNVSECIKAAIVAAGFDWRPYVLRAYFDTQLLIAESKGKVAHDYRVFWMGHKGTIENRYTTNKGRLPDGLVDDMRESYARCVPFLETTPTRTGTATLQSIMRVSLLGVGYGRDEVDKMDLDAMTEEQYAELLEKGARRAEASAGPKQLVIPESELPKYLADGWVAKMPVNGSKFVVERPGP